GTSGARRPLPAADSRGTIRVGEISLAELPVVCAGRVVDGAGEALAGASLGLLHHLPSLKDWDALDGFEAKSDDGGAFTIRGYADDLDLALHASLAGHVEQRRLEFQRGASALEIVLERGGSLAGRLRLPAGLE